MELVTTKEDVSSLLENFSEYVNPDGREDAWFEVSEINQQFAWEDVPEETLTEWLEELVAENLVEASGEGYRWLVL